MYLIFPLGMPQNLSFNKVNSSEYLLTWGLPIYSRNNVDVIYYSVHCSSPDHAGLVFNLSTEARRAEISGLLPFTVYSCCVSALTNRGTSPPACLLVKTSEEGIAITIMLVVMLCYPHFQTYIVCVFFLCKHWKDRRHSRLLCLITKHHTLTTIGIRLCYIYGLQF